MTAALSGNGQGPETGLSSRAIDYGDSTVEGFQIGKVFQPPGGALVPLEVREAEDRDAKIPKFNQLSRFKALRKVDARDACVYFDSKRGHAQPHDLFRFKKQVNCRRAKSELVQRFHKLAGVRFTPFDPDIEVACRTRVPVVIHGVAADQKVLNAVGA